MKKGIEKQTATEIVASLGTGTTRPLLVKCDNGQDYAVKLAGTQDQYRLLINEFLSGLILQGMRLPCPAPTIVEVPRTVAFSKDLELTERDRVRTLLGETSLLQGAGAEYQADHTEVGAGLKTLDSVKNREVVLGAIVFDTWVYNYDARQFLGRQAGDGRWELMLFDNDGAFGRDWIFLDQTVCRCDTKCGELNEQLRQLVKAKGAGPFEAHLKTLEEVVSQEFLDDMLRFVPNDWRNLRFGNLSPETAVEHLEHRRMKVRDMLHAAKH